MRKEENRGGEERRGKKTDEKKTRESMVLVAHASNPSYLGN
jgi:hypothetical protein